MKILKFGGTSVGSVQSIQTLIEILKKKLQSWRKTGSCAIGHERGYQPADQQWPKAPQTAKTLRHNWPSWKQRHFDVVKSLLDIQHQNPAYTRLKDPF